jgi:hypothetical protein
MQTLERVDVLLSLRQARLCGLSQDPGDFRKMSMLRDVSLATKMATVLRQTYESAWYLSLAAS